MGGESPTGGTNLALIPMIAGAGIDAWAVLIVGILTIAVSLGLFRGSNAARIIMAVVFTLNLVVAVWAIVIGVDFWDQVVAAVLAIVGLVFLFSAKANAFFTQ